MKILASEKIAAYSHCATIPIIAIGSLALVILAKGDFSIQLVSIIYGLSGIFLFSASFLYHSKKQMENDKTIWRKLDHTAIFFLIAGTYTPLCFLYLEGKMKWGILIAQWSLVMLGTLFKFLFINAPRVFGTIVYLVMGWLVLVPMVSLVENMPRVALIFLVAGGLSYTIGAVIYACKRPNPRPGFFGFHEIFHLFISGGAILHLVMLIDGVKHHFHS
ncbi:PAQR family membrane homeostasis protein TrhA [Desulfogranum marinum]|uniref:PAQR family membrane homeostasis protein TrhA n=1 Tax=Desulfogranum marinum TaxID=453220 RepID=UPI0019636711|nr:hemolysin III family protein [Desulfogranum marinum]MBM9510979.1 hemolysin III family protein [Desulfogranum marinum]